MIIIQRRFCKYAIKAILTFDTDSLMFINCLHHILLMFEEMYTLGATTDKYICCWVHNKSCAPLRQMVYIQWLFTDII